MHYGPLVEAFSALKNYINELLAYRPKGKLLKSAVALLRPSGSAKSNLCELDKVCVNPIKLVTFYSNATVRFSIVNKLLQSGSWLGITFLS